jgi:diguanylate cyclase
METIEAGILAAMSEVYISIFALDLDGNKMYSIKSNPIIDQLTSAPKTLQAKMNNAMSKIAVPEHVEMITAFTSLATIRERMQGKKVITQVFQGQYNGWCKARFIRIGEDDSAPLRYVLYTVECIDEEKRKENQLRHLAQTDQMTGLLNRGYGEQSIDHMMKSNRPGMFVLFDVDKFKRINDIYGHGVGDQVLIAVASAMKQVKTDDDIVMRLGGDEFAAYFVDITDQKTGSDRIEQLLKKIAEIHIDPIEEEISVSLGAVIYKEGLDFYTAYHTADRGVYASKLNKGSSFDFRG